MTRVSILLGIALLLLAGCTTATEPDPENRVSTSEVGEAVADEEQSVAPGAAETDDRKPAGPTTTERIPEQAAAEPEVQQAPAPVDPAPTRPPAVPAVDLRIADPEEQARLSELLAAAGFALLPPDVGPAEADIILSDAPLRQDEAVHVDSWAAVVHQRHDILDLRLDQLRAALSGILADWSSFGGAAQPLTVLLPDDLAATVRRALRLPSAAGVALPLAELVEAVRRTPGALAIVPLHALTPGLLPLVINGHDPLRDAAIDSPLRLERWLRTPDARTRAAVLAALGWTHPPRDNPFGLIATGDYIPVRCVPDSVRFYGDGDFNSVFEQVGERLRSADAAVVSMEVSVVDDAFITPCLETFILSAPVAAVEALAYAGVDVVTLAGNHSADCYGGCGRATAISSTIEVLEARGISHAGTGANLSAARRPAVVDRDGVRIAVLSYEGQAAYYFAREDQPGVAPLLEEVVREDIAAARTIADHVIVAFSSGAEYSTTTLPQQDAAVRLAIEAGASLVIGNHPHAIQPLVTLDGAVAAFALGNFVFDQDWSIETTQSILLEAGFTAERLIGYRVRPVVIRHNYQPETVDPAGAEGRQILARLWAATDAWLAR